MWLEAHSCCWQTEVDQFTLTDRPVDVSEQCSPNTHTEEEEEEEEGKGQTGLKVNIEG